MNRKIKLAVSLLWMMVVCIPAGCSSKKDYVAIEDISDSFPITAEVSKVNPQMVNPDGPQAVLHTTAGDITLQLYPKQAPEAVENFIALAKEGYYDGSRFFYVKRDEIAQTGKPVAGEERSSFREPFTAEHNNGLYHFAGAVGMVTDESGQHQSQFYLMVQNAVPEDDRLVESTFYMNELIRTRTAKLNEQNADTPMSEEEITAFEEALNAEIQAIGTDGVPQEYREQYASVAEQYMRCGGAWGLDGKHTIFAQIVEGFNVAEAITQVRIRAENRSPQKDVVIEYVEIME